MIKNISAPSPELVRFEYMSEEDFSAFSRVIHRHTGIIITPSKQSMLASRLSRRMKKLGISSFTEYRRLLEDASNVQERRALISVVTTNVTSFFRESVHFDVLASIVPGFIESANSGSRIRIWSAGCSSGEEAFSIAMTLAKNWPGFSEADLRILATDIDPEMVAVARSGIYGANRVGKDGECLVSQYTQKDPDGNSLIFGASLRNIIRFEELNLLCEWPFIGMFDVIFCRNVVIYFDTQTRQLLWRRFAERLKPGGILFIGHSERVDSELEPYLQPCGVTQYKRTIQPLD